MATFVDTSLAAVTAVAISTAFINDTGTFRPHLLVRVLLNGTVTNTTIDVSALIVDTAGVEQWHPVQTLSVRTLPGGAKTVDLSVFEAFGSKSMKVSLETAITGGGTVTLQYAFA